MRSSFPFVLVPIVVLAGGLFGSVIRGEEEAAAPVSVAGLLPACEAVLVQGPEAALSLGEEPHACSQAAPIVRSALLENCEARQHGVTAPYGGDPFVGQAAQPPNLHEAIEAFVTWAEAHPERASDLGVLGLTEAMVEAFPCPT